MNSFFALFNRYVSLTREEKKIYLQSSTTYEVVIRRLWDLIEVINEDRRERKNCVIKMDKEFRLLINNLLANRSGGGLSK